MLFRSQRPYPGGIVRVILGVEGDDLVRPLQGLLRCRSNRVQLPDEPLAGAVGGRQGGSPVDAPNDAIDFLELPVAATLRSRDVLVVGELCVVWSAPTLAPAPSSATSTSSSTSPSPAITALVTRGTVPGVVPVKSAAEAGSGTSPATLDRKSVV